MVLLSCADWAKALGRKKKLFNAEEKSRCILSNKQIAEGKSLQLIPASPPLRSLKKRGGEYKSTQSVACCHLARGVETWIGMWPPLTGFASTILVDSLIWWFWGPNEFRLDWRGGVQFPKRVSWPAGATANHFLILSFTVFMDVYLWRKLLNVVECTIRIIFPVVLW